MPLLPFPTTLTQKINGVRAIFFATVLLLSGYAHFIATSSKAVQQRPTRQEPNGCGRTELPICLADEFKYPLRHTGRTSSGKDTRWKNGPGN